MKLLLTSAGITNQTIEREMWRLLGGKHENIKLLFCTTASNYVGGDMKDWVVEDLLRFRDLGFEIDICDINGIEKDKVLRRLEQAEVFFFEGGNSQWLSSSILKLGLREQLIELLKNRLWIGASAGSIALCPTVLNSVQDLFDESVDYLSTDGLGFVNFQFIPHLNSDSFPKIRAENLQNAIKNLQKIDGKYVYIVDDDGAVSVDGENVRVVSEGEVIEKEIL
jgi:dipeptidase E